MEPLPPSKYDRNNIIAIAVLRGWSLREVASIFNISGVMVRHITEKVVKRSAPLIYRSVKHGSLFEYRENKNRIIEAIRQGDRL